MDEYIGRTIPCNDIVQLYETETRRYIILKRVLILLINDVLVKVNLDDNIRRPVIRVLKNYRFFLKNNFYRTVVQLIFE